MVIVCSRTMLKVSVFCLLLNNLLAQELLHNNDFEVGNSLSPWQCQDCSVQLIHSDKYHGHSSVQVTNRHHTWSGISQTFSVTGSHYYKFSGFIKLKNVGNNKMYTEVKVVLNYRHNGKEHYDAFYISPYHQADNKWAEIGGDFHVPGGVSSIHIYVEIPDVSVDYLFDDGSCKMIQHDSQWKTHANQRIENIRKGTLTLSVASNGHVNTNGLTIEIKQTKSKFAFGTAFNARYVTDSTHTAYQNFLFNNFEWAVPENALKWKQMEWTKGHINYDKGMNAVKKLRSHGIKVRGHNMFWDVGERVPDWLKGMSSSQVLQEMHKRVSGMISHSKGTLEHWDVNNENLHGHTYEDLTKHANVNKEIFDWVHAAEPNVKLFLNEYNVISWRDTTTAFKNQGKQLKDAGAPIYGMGVQGHFGSSHINMDQLKYRLDKVAETGLPIWITELTIKDSDENAKASALDDVMTMFLSHPAIEGVLIWGFWDGAVYDKKIALATGSSVTPNAAGRKWQELYHQRFRTNESHSFNGHSSLKASIFKGEHQLIIKQNGKTIHTEIIDMDQSQQTATLHLQTSGQNIQVSHVAFG